jgi:hypothetical protein
LEAKEPEEPALPATEIPEIPLPKDEPTPLPVSSVEPDFSFAQTEQFKKFLEQLEDEITAKNNPPPAAVEAEEPDFSPSNAEEPVAGEINVPEVSTDSAILVEDKEEPAPLPPDALTFKREEEAPASSVVEPLPLPAGESELPEIVPPVP